MSEIMDCDWTAVSYWLTPDPAVRAAVEAAGLKPGDRYNIGVLMTGKVGQRVDQFESKLVVTKDPEGAFTY
jgi:hypothetical protein